LIEPRTKRKLFSTQRRRRSCANKPKRPANFRADERRAIEGAIVALREALAGRDYKQVRAFVEVLNQATTPQPNA